MVQNSSFLKRLEDSGLATEFLPEIRESISSGATDSDVAKKLTNRRILTDYQAKSLLEDSGAALVIGEYEVLDQIGRGGMGYVVKARHRTMDRLVAIKFILPNYTESVDVRQRFEREVKAAAKLEHPNIVTAYDAGSMADGSHYLVMRYVPGKDLSTRVREESPLSVSAAIDVICQTARGLAYAHEQGIVHRDIKPANLLLDPQGVVRILDMGLARMRASPGDDDPDGLTNTGSMMGTIDYMAPEQAMDARSADHRADIYSLGCTLFFLLMGKAPYASDSMMSRLLAHRDGAVPLLSSMLSGIPPELESIYIRMMAKDREQRYQSMDEVIAALSAIDVEEDNSSALATVEFPEDGSGGFIQLPDDESAVEDAAQQATVVPDHDSKPTMPTGSRPQGQRTTPVATILETVSGLEGATALTQPDDTEPPTTAETVFETPSQLSTSEPEPTTIVHGGRPLIAGIVAATALVALLFVVFGRDPDPTEISGEKGKIPGSAMVEQAGVPPSEDTVSTGQSATNYALDFDGESGVVLPSLALANDGPFTIEARVASQDDSGGFIVKWHNGVELLINNDRFIFGKVKSPQSPIVFAAAANSGVIESVALVFNGRSLSLYIDGTLCESVTAKGFNGGNSQRLAIGAGIEPDASFDVYRGFRGQIDEVRISTTARYQENYVPADRLTADEHTLALYHFDEGSGDIAKDSSGNDHHGKLIGAKWVNAEHGTTQSTESPEVPAQNVVPEASTGFWGIAVSPDSSRLAVGGDSRIVVYELPSLRQTRVFSPAESLAWAGSPVEWSPDGKTIAARVDNHVQFWNVESGLTRKPESLSNRPTRAIAWSPDGKWLVSGDHAGERALKVWDPASGEIVQNVELSTNTVTCLAWSPDGESIAVGISGKSLEIWQVADWRRDRTLDVGCNCVSWSPDGTWLAAGRGDAGDGDYVVKTWNTDTWESGPEFQGHRSFVGGLAWHPGSKQLVSAGQDTWFFVWDLETGQPTRRFGGNQILRQGVRWSANEKWIVTLNTNLIEVWDAKVPGPPIQSLESN